MYILLWLYRPLVLRPPQATFDPRPNGEGGSPAACGDEDYHNRKGKSTMLRRLGGRRWTAALKPLKHDADYAGEPGLVPDLRIIFSTLGRSPAAAAVDCTCMSSQHMIHVVPFTSTTSTKDFLVHALAGVPRVWWQCGPSVANIVLLHPAHLPETHCKHRFVF